MDSEREQRERMQEQEHRERMPGQGGRRHQPDLSDHVLIELIRLAREAMQDRRDLVVALSQLSNKVDCIGAQMARNMEIVMAQFNELSAKVDELTIEITEITNYIHGKGAELEAANAEVVRLTAEVAALAPNQITQAQRDSLAASQAKVQAAIDALNVFTPAVVVEPPVEEPVVEEPPVEPAPEEPPPVEEPSFGRRNR